LLCAVKVDLNIIFANRAPDQPRNYTAIRRSRRSGGLAPPWLESSRATVLTLWLAPKRNSA